MTETETNSTYAQAKIKDFALQHGVLCESYQLFAVFEVKKMKNKENYHGGFQQQSSQRLIDRRYKHMNRLDAIQSCDSAVTVNKSPGSGVIFDKSDNNFNSYCAIRNFQGARPL